MFRIAFSTKQRVATSTEIQYLFGYGITIPYEVDLKLEGVWNSYSRSNTCFSSASVLNDGHKHLSEAVGAVHHVECVKDMSMWTVPLGHSLHSCNTHSLNLSLLRSLSSLLSLMLNPPQPKTWT